MTQSELKEKAIAATLGPLAPGTKDDQNVDALEYAKRHRHSGLVYPYWPAYDAFRAGYQKAAKDLLVLALIQRMEALQEALEEFSTTHLNPGSGRKIICGRRYMVETSRKLLAAHGKDIPLEISP